MTQDEFDHYRIAVADRYANKTYKLLKEIWSGKHYDEIKRQVKELVLLFSYTDILDHYTLPTSEEEEAQNFFSAVDMKNIALKINWLTGLRYNYNFKNY